MSDTATKQTTRLVIPYANGEKAFVRSHRIASVPNNSTAIRYWSYKPEKQTLTVQYANGDKFYDYEGVPFSAVYAMMLADSLGNFIAKNIKPFYTVEAF